MATQKRPVKPKTQKQELKTQRESVNPEDVRLVRGKGCKTLLLGEFPCGETSVG